MLKKFFSAFVVVLAGVMLSGCFSSGAELSVVNNAYFVHSVIFSNDGQTITELIYVDFSKFLQTEQSQKESLIEDTYELFLQEKVLLENEFSQILINEGVVVKAAHQEKYHMSVLNQDELVSYK